MRDGTLHVAVKHLEEEEGMSEAVRPPSPSLAQPRPASPTLAHPRPARLTSPHLTSRHAVAMCAAGQAEIQRVMGALQAKMALMRILKAGSGEKDLRQRP